MESSTHTTVPPLQTPAPTVVTRSGAPRRCVHGTASVPRGGSTGGSREVKTLALGARGPRVTVTLAKPAGTALPPTSVNGLVQLQGPD